MATSEEQPGQAVHEKPYQLQEIIRARPTGFDCNSPRAPYLKFTLGPGQLTRLIVRIWSHDQGRADTTSSLNPYADSNTWFALGLIQEDEEPDLYEFQRNVRASFDIRCHTHEWNLGVPSEDDEEMDDVQAWIESLAFMEGGEVGIFPLARYPGWTNLVWRMEVKVYSHLTDTDDTGDPHDNHNEDETTRQVSAHSASVVKLELDETVHILRQFNDLANQLADLQIRDPEAMSNSIIPRVSVVPGGFHPMQLRKLDMIAKTLAMRSRATSNVADLDNAIFVEKQALTGMTPEWGRVFETEKDENRPSRLVNLGTQLNNRARLTKNVDDINEAINLGQEALAISPRDHENRCGYLNNVGNLLAERFLVTHDLTDLDQCIEYLNECIDTAPAGHESMSRWLLNLGARLDLRFSNTDQDADRDQARGYLRAVLGSEQADVTTRVYAAYHLLPKGYMDQDKHEAFIDAKTAVDLIPISAPLSLQPEDKQFFLGRVVGIACEAAAIALNDGQSPVTAIELLETGRGVLASFFHDRRTDLSLLEAKHPELARSFIELRADLDKPTYRDAFEDIESFDDPLSLYKLPETDQRHKASTKMAALLEDIRAQPGFDRFLSSATGSQMQDAAEDGPIVIINISSRRCDALIIEQSRIHAFELPKLTKDDVLRRADDVGSFKTLMWLWDSVVGPVLDHLGFSKHCVDDNWPHIVWIPTGPLVRFPLHAAGYHLAPGHRTAMDRVMSSYSSSVKAIMTSRQQRYHEFGSDVVLIGMGETPGLPHSSLRYARTEVDVVRGVFNSTSLNCVQPTSIKKDVLAALETCRIFHFAGHGESNRLDPLKSHILLDDWMTQPLTTASLMEKNLASSPPFLAYLSACKTSENSNQDLVDENIHLTSAFQLSGFRHVVGTLWEVDDELSSEMARLTYEFLITKGISDASVSGGLHFATKKLRDIWAASVIADLKQREKADKVRDAVHDDEQEGDTSHHGEDLRSMRDIRRTEIMLPLWVPYIHYGP
ncbi:hypothetical protein CGCS363_v004261 [Colletotrichum siamense]|uniref:uncharacterized protein n=1 Tax=Colletotrichum siamense TaxID=690259 RepID=UPI00187319E6|nr:uncharacterized protein CGCS363_v004261 [Colletotrichum siamense]KAF5505400.1 hypothetical protein CGCS363_v004261 [Colletotrichum siamense]